MTPATRVLIAVCVLGVAGAGATAYVLTNRPVAPAAPSVPAAVPVPAPASPTLAPTPAPATPTPPAPEASATPAPPTVKFSPFVQAFSLIRDSAAYSAASLSAPQFYPLKSGTALISVSRSDDGQWILAMTQDGQATCIPAADLGPYDPARAPKPASIDGGATVVDTATLNVNQVPVNLTGVAATTPEAANHLQEFIDAAGSTVHCVPNGPGYTCTLPNGADVARIALFNGAAQSNADSTPDYLAQQDAAKAARRGIWK